MEQDLRLARTHDALRGAQDVVRAIFLAIFESFRRHIGLVAVLFAYSVACYATGWASGGDEVVKITPFFGELALISLGLIALALLARAGLAALRATPDQSMFGAVTSGLSSMRVPSERIANLFAPLFLIPLMLTTFSSFKRLIPFAAPFSWDQTFVHWDRWLHGSDVWLLLHPIFATPAVTGIISLAYNMWFIVMLGTFMWQAGTTARPLLRMRFLTSFLLCWIVIGTGMAILFSSAGPCYFGRVTGLPDPFAPLMDYLHAQGHWRPTGFEMSKQDLLWRVYQTKGTVAGGGISAMPSMHVSLAVLMALLGWKLSRALGVVFTLFALIIMVGSVHLGWHYAVDGYVGAAASLAIWIATGWFLRRIGYADRGERRGREKRSPHTLAAPP